ncbi:response regulator transcription factor [bacterium]|nr:response regulator transcription factor [bacterium]
MAKQRPSKAEELIKLSKVRAEPPKNSTRYWSQRLHQAAYTRSGVAHKVRHWSIKIQHRGIRRSISLATISRSLAAQRALQVYESIQSLGWQAAEDQIHLILGETPPQPGETALPRKGTRTNGFWKQRLSQRSYLEEAGLQGGQQWSVRIESGGINDYFPTASASTEQAIRFAGKLHSHIEQLGWSATCQTFPREFTLAIFWSVDPVTCTYATMLSLVTEKLEPFIQKKIDTRKVVIVEPNPEIVDTIRFWISQNAGFEVIGAAPDLDETQSIVANHPCDLILINRQTHTTAPNPAELLKLKKHPVPAIIGYGLYEDSNQIFRSVSGVNRGYFLRRRNPDQLLAPVSNNSMDLPFRSTVSQTVTNYFMQLFTEITHSETSSPLSLLTRRELEILGHLSSGYLDKEIAVRLRISNWTVRNHLKRIYSKLGIHNRTEAAIKYLQK